MLAEARVVLLDRGDLVMGGGAGAHICISIPCMSSAEGCHFISSFSPPKRRLVAAMPGPSVRQPSQPALHCARSVHSLGRLPFVALSLGWPAKEGWRGRARCCSALSHLCQPPVGGWLGHVAGEAWSPALPVHDLRGFRKGQRQDLVAGSGDPGGVSTGNLCSGFLFDMEEEPWSLDCGPMRAGTESHSSLALEKSEWHSQCSEDVCA